MFLPSRYLVRNERGMILHRMTYGSLIVMLMATSSLAETNPYSKPAPRPAPNPYPDPYPYPQPHGHQPQAPQAAADPTAPAAPKAPVVPPLTPELLAAKSDIQSKHFSSIAVIEGDGGSGTGFIVNEGEKLRLYTAAHVIVGNKRLKVRNAAGRQFSKFGAFEVASNSDLARIELTEEFETSLKISPAGVFQVNDPVLAIGNSGGTGALTFLDGIAISMGPDVVELSNGFIQGNSGGPVISLTSGDVVAVVTHLIAAREDIWAKDTAFADVRRFATRTDREIDWQLVPIGKFLAEGATLEGYNQNTRIMFALSALDPTQDGLRLDSHVTKDGPTLLSIFDENKTVPTVAELIAMNTKLGGKSLRTSENELRQRFYKFYEGAIFKLNQDDAKFQPSQYSGYHRQRAEQEKKWRAEALEGLKAAAQSMR